MTPRAHFQPQPSERRERREGIALLVVMIVFVVLYLVVYQLHFSTKMEEHIARVRSGDGELTIANYSAGLFVITHLVEDLKKDMSATSAGAGAGTGDPAGLGEASKGVASIGDDKMGAGGSFASLGGAGGGTGKPHDSLYENIFQENHQQVGELTVKITTVDGERAFDLNRLFDYVRLKSDEVESGGVDLTPEELENAVAGKEGKDAEQGLADKVRQRIQDRRSTRKGSKGADTKGIAKASDKEKSGPADAMDPLAAGGTADAAAAQLSEYEEAEFIRPEPERIEATRNVVERALLMTFSINENEFGYRYSRKYDAGGMAQRIVDYVLERRQAAVQNRIYLVSELLNLCSPGGMSPADITPEVYYGPIPQLVGDDEIPVGDGFILRRDEFGDIVPEYQCGDVDMAAKEEEKRQLDELQSQFGQFADFGGMGLGRLAGNALTRGMNEPPIAVDQNGEEYMVEVPRPIGLKDLFTAFSTGRININTASAPILFALLQSCSEQEANTVALGIRDYRKRFQEEIDDTGVQKVGSDKTATPDLGQPKRRKKDETASKTGLPTKSGASATGALGSVPAGVDPSLAEDMQSSYQDLELNYFTSLEQIELIDGTDGGRDDLLRKDEGIQKVSAETDTLYRRVIYDLEKVKCFSSTYFNAELKAKPKEGRAVKTGYLTVRRDTQRKMVEVVLWKNLQK